MKKEIKEHCFPLSLSQQNIWNLERSLPGTSVNNISTTLQIREQEFSKTALQKIKRHLV